MMIDIVCPSCGKRSNIAAAKVPSGKLKTTCHSCGHRFPMDKHSGLNCERIQTNQAHKETHYPEQGWRVENPAFEGMLYTLEEVTKLVHTGLITPQTRILPPNESQYLLAEDLSQLQKAFEKVASRNARTRPR